MSSRIAQWTDEDYARLEEDIRDLVKSLHCLGVMTVMSCQGHIRTHWYETGILPWPWVVIQTTKEEMDRLMQIITAWNKLNPNKKWELSQRRIHGSFTPHYIKTVMMRAYPGTIVRALVPVAENPKTSAEVLTELQKQAPGLSQFLINPS